MRYLSWAERVSAATHVAYILQPVVVTGPGVYETRGGELARVERINERGLFRCRGTYACGIAESWPVSGRIFPYTQSCNDLVRKVASADAVGVVNA